MSANYSADLIIIGAGLTGLSLNYFLRDSGLNILVLEGRDRIGGRIHTLYQDGLPPREMGATWLGKKHRHLNALLSELDLPVFPQLMGDRAIYEPLSTSPPQIVSLPPNDQPSYRIVGGSSSLIQRLSSFLAPQQLLLGVKVDQILTNKVAGLIKGGDKQFTAPIIVSTLPPFLLRATINFTPALPDHLNQLLNQTHTWMGDSIKISFTYEEPFWRKEGHSGTIFSNVGPIPEMYDHTDYQDQYFALKGFFNGNYHSLNRDERKEMALSQLEKYFGDQALTYLRYDEVVWAKESYTFQSYPQHVLPHQHNGHPLLRRPLFEGRFYLAGSETAADHPGYMDGAVSSARYVADQILKNA